MNRLKRCVFFHDHKFLWNKRGGVYSEGKLGFSVLHRYFGLGDEVCVVSRCVEMPEGKEQDYVLAIGDGIKFSPVLGSAWRLIFSKFLFSNFRIVSQAIKYSDIVVIRLPSFISFFVFPMCLILKKRFVVEVVGDAREAIYYVLGGGGVANILSWFFDFYVKLVVRNALGAIYVTKFHLQEKYKNFGVNRFASNVEVHETDALVLNRRIRAIEGWYGQIVNIGVIASYYNSYKGLHVLCEAVGSLRIKYGVNVYIKLLGSGNAEVLSNIIGKNNAYEWFVHDGILPSSKVSDWLDDIDIYCQPSLTEGLPRSLIEAMSRGCPCIGTNVGGIPELLPPSSLVEPGQPQQLCEKIYEFILSRDILIRESRNNFCTSKEYTIGVLTQSRQEFFDAVKGRI